MIFNLIKISDFIVLSSALILFLLYIIFNFFTISGLILFISLFGIYSLSIYLNNVFLQFLSMSFFFIFLFFFLYYIFVLIYFNKNKLSIISEPSESLHPLKEYKLHFISDNFPLFFPMIYFSLNFDLFENDLLVDNNSRIIETVTGKSFYIKNIFKRHGIFLFKNCRFFFNDIFGLTKYRLSLDFNQEINVHTFFIDNTNPKLFLEEGGEEIFQSIKKIDSTDFFENRKYYPGDDVRRINWKLFAHSKVLHIREIEKNPPKTGELTILFMPYSEDIIEYEYISSLFYSTINNLLDFGYELKVYSPAFAEKKIFDKYKENILMKIINNSYKPFKISNANDFPNSNFIIFSSLSEYKKNIYESNFKNSYAAVTFFNNEPYLKNYKELLKLVLNVEKYDNLIKDILFILKNDKEKMLMNKELDKIKNFSAKNNILVDFYENKKLF